MTLTLSHSNAQLTGNVRITGSKSESNRLLILQALFPNLQLENLSNSDDVQVMQQALSHANKQKDIHHAGTTMRFLTAFYATTEGADVQLTGSQRMQERPIGILVAALQQLGADISYTNKEGYPPIHIKGKKIVQSKVVLPASVSSQYISALMLVAPRLEKGLEIELEGTITSVPYIKMTQALLERVGVTVTFEGNRIHISHFSTPTIKYPMVVESDWSSASYFYSLVALSNSATIKLSSYRNDSLQGDAVLQTLYAQLGVRTTFTENGIVLEKVSDRTLPKKIIENLVHAPDLAQTLVVSCAGLGIECELSGLHTLKIKETDRLVALQKELTKLGATISVTEDSLHLEAGTCLRQNIAIATYQDHRMALAFAPLGLKVPIQIQEAEVVSKSYPDFWNDLTYLGYRIDET